MDRAAEKNQVDDNRIAFYKDQCSNCPCQKECHPDIKSRTAALVIPLKSRICIVESFEVMDDKIRTQIGRIRNGVETVPSIIRNKISGRQNASQRKAKDKTIPWL